MFSDDPQAVFEELREASAGGLADYSGIDYAMLDRGEAAYWPFPAGSGGTPRLFTEGFAHPDGRAVMVPVKPAKRNTGPLFNDGSLALATGRLLEHYQSGSQTRRVAELLAAQPQVRLLIHPASAASRGIADGDYATVGNERGEVLCRAELSNAVRPDTVFLPFHFPGQENANRLTEAVTDPISGMPEFKTSRVWVGRAAATPVTTGLADAGLSLHAKEAS